MDLHTRFNVGFVFFFLKYTLEVKLGLPWQSQGTQVCSLVGS